MIAWTVIVVRDDAPADDISVALLAAGAAVVALPLMRMEAIAFAPPAGPFDVVAFTSSSAVDAVGLTLWGDARVAAVGQATAGRLRERGVNVDVVGDAGGAALARLLIAQGPPGMRVLLPRTQGGNDDLSRLLQEAGAAVVVVDVTRAVPLVVDVAAAVQSARAPRAVLFTSPQRVRAFLLQAAIPPDVVVVAIGATTADALRTAGQRVDAVPTHPCPKALLEGLRALQKES